MQNHHNLAILILAAGSSKRLGFPKQLISYHGCSLLQTTIEKSLTITPHVYALLGSHFKECSSQAQNAKIIYNQNFNQGIGSSIKAGIKALSNYDFILITLCDYPLLPIQHLQTMISYLDPQRPIATSCKGILSSPAIFPKLYYPLLLELDDKEGAQKILRKTQAIKVEINERYLLDIDTKEDLQKLHALVFQEEKISKT